MIDQATRQQVWQEAASRCEYCRLPQFAVDATFHVEHVIAKQHGGSDDVANLALACDRCNLYKGPNLSGIAPKSGGIAPLFHPRRDSWQEHFESRNAEIAGLTPTGRATVQLLRMNAARRRQLRQVLLEAGDL